MTCCAFPCMYVKIKSFARGFTVFSKDLTEQPNRYPVLGEFLRPCGHFTAWFGQNILGTSDDITPPHKKHQTTVHLYGKGSTQHVKFDHSLVGKCFSRGNFGKMRFR